jgi:hypothetical protein
MYVKRVPSKRNKDESRKTAAAETVQGEPGTVTQPRGLFAGLGIGKPLHYNNLTIFPLSWAQSLEPPYMLLGKAIEAGQAVVEEVCESGSVPSLAVTNKTDRPLLIPEGEILIGAKQNRVVNITVLVAAGVKFVMPVSCVEAGRWRYQSRHFESKFYALPSLRNKKIKAVQRNRAAGGHAESDQGEVWDEVRACLAKVHATSATASLTDGFLASQEHLDKYRHEFALPKDAAGVLLAKGTHVLGMDLFDSPATLQAMWDRLRDAYFFDALADNRKRRATSRKSAQAFLDHVAASARPRQSALGLGEELEIAGDNLVGGALTYSGQLCHVAAFSERA